MILVTHDFEDAATLADRVGVLVDGRLLQVGTPAELVAAPVDPFVARFTGANLVPGAVVGEPGRAHRGRARRGRHDVVDRRRLAGRVAVAVYPWEVSLARDVAGRLGGEPRPRADRADHVAREPCPRRVGPLVAEVTAASVERLGLREGEVVVASFKATAARLLPLA